MVGRTSQEYSEHKCVCRATYVSFIARCRSDRMELWKQNKKEMRCHVLYIYSLSVPRTDSSSSSRSVRFDQRKTVVSTWVWHDVVAIDWWACCESHVWIVDETAAIHRYRCRTNSKRKRRSELIASFIVRTPLLKMERVKVTALIRFSWARKNGWRLVFSVENPFVIE